MKKLLKFATATTALATGAITAGVVTSCSCSKTFIEKADTDVKIIGNNMVAYFQFTLKSALKENQKLVVEHDDGGSFTFGDMTVKGKLVTVPIYWLNTNIYEEQTWTGDFVFNCIDTKSNKILWSNMITGSKATYYPYCTLDSEMHYIGQETDLDTSTNTLTGRFKFNIPTGLPSEEYKPHFKVSVGQDYDNAFTINEHQVKINLLDQEGKNIEVVVPGVKNTTVSEGDSYQLDIQVYCMFGDTDIPIWISNNFKTLKVSYFNEAKVIPTEYLDTEDMGGEYQGYARLKGIKIPSENAEEYNTLLIPYADKYGKPILSIGNNSQPIADLPTTVTKIIFGTGSILTYIEDNAFKGNTNIKYIDASNILDTAVGLETMKFGTDAFYGWAEKGTVIWNPNFSIYKRHMLMLNLYQAGLTSPDWFNVIKVGTESELREACAMGSNIQLTNNITIATQYDSVGNIKYTGQVEVQKSLVLDLHGFTITSEQPIYDFDAKQFAILGVWQGSEIIITDLYKDHNGSIKACENEGLQLSKTPTDPKSYNTKYYNYCYDFTKGKWLFKPRESRAIYVRTDTPTKARTSIWILAGKFYGNCTTIFTWNCACWIEERFKEEGDTTHKFAPEFHALTPYSDYDGKDLLDGGRELINCDDNDKMATGDAYFEIYGGKFFAVPKQKITGEYITGEYAFYNPEKAEADIDPETGEASNWVADGFKAELITSGVETPYYVVHAKQ